MAFLERPLLRDEELSRPALVLAKRFVQRWDLYARQLDDGRFVCVHELLGVDLLFDHLRGRITLGTYLLDQEGRARFVVFDADEKQQWQDLGSLARKLAEENVPEYLETSRRGGHLWLFLSEQVEAQEARRFGYGVLEAHGVEGVELFPKQDRLARGPGSLIRMPLGVHRLTGRRYGFYHADGSPLASTIREQIDALGAPETVAAAAFEAYRSLASSEPETEALEASEGPPDTLSKLIKARLSVLEFVGQYVDLKSTPTGAIGLCPFHEDHQPSFGVNAEENYWHCFAGCGGGSVIDFWMRWRGCDFTAAVGELAEILL